MAIKIRAENDEHKVKYERFSTVDEGLAYLQRFGLVRMRQCRFSDHKWYCEVALNVSIRNFNAEVSSEYHAKPLDAVNDCICAVDKVISTHRISVDKLID